MTDTCESATERYEGAVPLEGDPSDLRFEFGKNWAQYLALVNRARIAQAEESLRTKLGVERLDGVRFLDIGSGSGLFSLAAARLGAKVAAFDYDPVSVAVSREIQRRFPDGHDGFPVARGSILDEAFVAGLGQFDCVYSWGVLHHTGDMWRAIDAASSRVVPGGRLFIAIYNDQGLISDFWKRVKRLYCSGPVGRWLVIPTFFAFFMLAGLAGDLLRRRNPLLRYTAYWKQRGMSRFRDWIDWLGGYPFEVARPSEIFNRLRSAGFELEALETSLSSGCNEFVFRRRAISDETP